MKNQYHQLEVTKSISTKQIANIIYFKKITAKEAIDRLKQGNMNNRDNVTNMLNIWQYFQGKNNTKADTITDRYLISRRRMLAEERKQKQADES